MTWAVQGVVTSFAVLAFGCDGQGASAMNDGGVDGPGTVTGSDGSGVACTLTHTSFNPSPKVNAQSTYGWSCSGTTRRMQGNGIPDHPVTMGTFVTPMSPQNLSISFPLNPAAPGKLTSRFRQATGYALNSVKFDPDTAGTCMGSATSPSPNGGCVMAMGRDPWLIEAIGGPFRFGTDESNAHTQPNGQYHYHGMPEAMIQAILRNSEAKTRVTLVGFAVDGFPIYARYGYTVAGDPTSPVKVMKGSWQLKANAEPGRPDRSVFPLGTFTNDYEYVSDSGDLDECNGRTGVTPEFPQGTYHYYITETFPFIQRCTKGNSL
jgi:YHYH protein